MMRCPELAELPPPPAGKTGWPWTEASPRALETLPNGQPAPRLSIVTPSYNQGKFLEETIRSVLLQGYPDVEYIIVDGGSTDNSAEVISKYQPWLSYSVSEPDQGQSDAINKGWRRCTGELLAWMNSDDYYLPNVFQTVAHAFAAVDTTDLIYGQMMAMDGRGEIRGLRTVVASPKEMLTTLRVPAQAASFFRRNVLETVGWLEPSLHYVMDFDLMLKVLSNARRTTPIPVPCAVFRFHSHSKTTTSEVEFACELLRVLDQVSAHWERYPALRDLGPAQVHSAFYRLASKHLYLANKFSDSLRYMVRACRAYPPATGSILGNEGARWLMRRILPLDYYRSLSSTGRLSSIAPSKKLATKGNLDT